MPTTLVPGIFVLHCLVQVDHGSVDHMGISKDHVCQHFFWTTMRDIKSFPEFKQYSFNWYLLTLKKKKTDCTASDFIIGPSVLHYKCPQINICYIGRQDATLLNCCNISRGSSRTVSPPRWSKLFLLHGSHTCARYSCSWFFRLGGLWICGSSGDIEDHFWN